MPRGCFVLKRSRLFIILALLSFLYFVNNPVSIYRKKVLPTKRDAIQPTFDLQSQTQTPQGTSINQFFLTISQPTRDTTAQTKPIKETTTPFPKAESEPEVTLKEDPEEPPRESAGGDVEEGGTSTGNLKEKDSEKDPSGDDVQLHITTKSPEAKNEKPITKDREEKKRTKKDLTLLSQEEYDNIKNTHDQRRKHIREVCDRFVIPNHKSKLYDHRIWDGRAYTSGGKSILPQPIRGASFQADKPHRVLYCWIYKAGSTSWNAMFARLLNRTEFDKKKNYFDIRKLMTPQSMRELVESMEFYSFVMVRHPFTRLLSAYRDRIQDMSHPSWQRETFGPKMLRTSRRGIKEMDMMDENGKLKIVPTFAEFVTYLLRTPLNRFDPHWTPYYRHCSPCTIDYSAVGKLETRDQDIPFILEEAGLAGKVDMQVLNENSNKGRGSTNDLLKEYYSTITFHQLRELYYIYEVDFHLFNYDIKPILALVYPNATIKPSLI